MPELLIGRETQRSAHSMGVTDFKSFHAELMAAPEELVAVQLGQRIDVSAEVLVSSIRENWSLQHKHIAFRQHMTSSLAMDQYHRHKKGESSTVFDNGFLATAEFSLASAATRLAVVDFGSGNLLNLNYRQARRAVSDTVRDLEPAGAYERYALIAGLALGRIQPSLPEDSEGLATSQLPAEFRSNR